MSNLSTPNVFLVRKWGENLGFNLELIKLFEECSSLKIESIKIIPDKTNIYFYLNDLVAKHKIKNIFFDTRIFVTNSHVNKLLYNLVDIVKINLLFRKHNVTSVCFVTDPLESGYSLVAELISNKCGIIVPIGSDLKLRVIQNKTILSGVYSPISAFTINRFSSETSIKDKDIFIGGSLYEPRKSFFEKLMFELNKKGISYNFRPKEKNDYYNYLNELSRFKIITNTNFRANSSQVHMVGRNVEAFAVGSLLITQETPLLEKFFQKGVHYIHAPKPIDMANQLEYYLKHPKEREIIARAGQAALNEYSQRGNLCHYILNQIDEINNYK